jgi:hypothetical protein
MKSKNLRLFYIHELLFQFSDSMLVIVLPVFIYKLFGSISAVFLFTFTWNLIYSILFIPVFNLAMKLKNPKYFMAIGMIFYITALWFFGQTTTENIKLIIPATLFFTLYITFYWMIRHWFFSVNTDHRKIGRQVGTLTIIRIAISFIAPIIGGWVSFFVSFNVTFILGAFAGLLSLIPILLFYAPPHPRGYDLKKVIGILKKPELKAIRPAYFWEGMGSVFINSCWILAFAIFIGNILDLGLLVGITTLLTAISIRLVGNWFDQRKRTTILNHVTNLKFITTALYLFLYFYPQMIFVWIIEFMNRFSLTMLYTVADSYLYAYSNKIHPVHFVLNREMHLNISRFIGSGILVIAFYFLPAGFLWVAIGLGAFMILGWMTLKRSDHLLH